MAEFENFKESFKSLFDIFDDADARTKAFVEEFKKQLSELGDTSQLGKLPNIANDIAKTTAALGGISANQGSGLDGLRQQIDKIANSQINYTGKVEAFKKLQAGLQKELNTTNRVLKKLDPESEEFKQASIEVQRLEKSLEEVRGAAGKTLLSKVATELDKVKKGSVDNNKAFKELGRLQSSLRVQLRQSSKELGRLVSEGKDVDKVEKEVRQLEDALEELVVEQGKLKPVSSILGKGFAGFKETFKQFAVGAFSFLTVQGAIQGVRSAFVGAFNTFRNFEGSLSNLEAITGASEKDLRFYEQAAIDLGSSTTRSASESVEAFQLMGSAKPDLLGVKEELVETTKAAVTLSEATKGPLAESTDILGSTLNQFGQGADQANRFINVLAAGAQKGSSLVFQTAAALDNSGTLLAANNVSFEEGNAAIQELARVSIKGSKAGIGLRNVALQIASSQEGATLRSKGLTAALKELAEQNLTVTELKKRFGKENVIVAQQLINNADSVGEMTKALTGTNIAFEQQKANTDNTNASLARLRSVLERVAIILGKAINKGIKPFVDGLADGISKLTPAFEGLLNIIGTIGGVLTGNIKIVTALGLAYLSLKVNLNSLGQTFRSSIKDVTAYNVGLKLGRGAALAFSLGLRAVKLALRALGIGLVIEAISFAVTKLEEWIPLWGESSNAIADTEKETKSFIQSNNQLVSSIRKERAELDANFKKLTDNNTKQKERAGIIKSLNKDYGEYIGFQLSEKSSLDDLKTAYDKINEAIITNAVNRAIANKAQQLTDEAITKEADLIDRFGETTVKKAREARASRDKEFAELFNAGNIDAIQDLPALDIDFDLQNGLEDLDGLASQLEGLPGKAQQIASNLKSVLKDVDFSSLSTGNDNEVENNPNNGNKDADARKQGLQKEEDDILKLLEQKTKERLNKEIELETDALEKIRRRRKFNIDNLEADLNSINTRIDQLVKDEQITQAEGDKLKADFEVLFDFSISGVKVDANQKLLEEKFKQFQDEVNNLNTPEVLIKADGTLDLGTFNANQAEIKAKIEEFKKDLLLSDAELAAKDKTREGIQQILDSYIELDKATQNREGQTNKGLIDARLADIEANANSLTLITKANSDFYDELGNLTKEGEAELARIQRNGLLQRKALFEQLQKLIDEGEFTPDELGFDGQQIADEISKVDAALNEFDTEEAQQELVAFEEKLQAIEGVVETSINAIEGLFGSLDLSSLSKLFDSVLNAIKSDVEDKSIAIVGAIASGIAVAAELTGQIAASMRENAQKELDLINQELGNRASQLEAKKEEEFEKQQEGFANSYQQTSQQLDEVNALSARGLTQQIDFSKLSIEELEKLQQEALKKRQNAVRLQILADGAAQLSGTLTAIVNIASSETLSKGAIGVISTGIAVASLLALLVSSRNKVKAAQAQFYHGGEFKYGYTGNGNPRDESTNLGSRPYTYHKREYITPHKPTKEYGDNLLKGIHLGERAKVVLGTQKLAKNYGLRIEEVFDNSPEVARTLASYNLVIPPPQQLVKVDYAKAINMAKDTNNIKLQNDFDMRARSDAKVQKEMLGQLKDIKETNKQTAENTSEKIVDLGNKYGIIKKTKNGSIVTKKSKGIKYGK